MKLNKHKTKFKRKAISNKTHDVKKPKVRKILTKKELIIKQKQERIILLWIASHCDKENCSNKNCNYMKKLWKHIPNCKDDNCKVKHCLSSRYILRHYHRCKDKKCKVCVPVRKKIAINDAAYTLINLNK